MFTDAIEAILRNHCTPSVIRSIENGGSAKELWQCFSEPGFLDLLVPEDEGGAGITLGQLWEILVLLGEYAAPVPFAHTILAKSLVGFRKELPNGMITLAQGITTDPAGQISCHSVPFGAVAEHILSTDGRQLILLDVRLAQRKHTGIHNSLSASFSWNDEKSVKKLGGDPECLKSISAALYSALILGAMRRTFEMTLAYCNNRVQFGKQISKFQSIQHQLSVMAEHIAAVSIASESAFWGVDSAPTLLRAAVAKARASEAVPLVANTAHALHGAIGITDEYDLHLLTRRLHEWRMCHGAETYWNSVIGNHFLAESISLSEFVRIN